jgi:RNA polymerase sigma-70 factor (ECF subfamily)
MKADDQAIVRECRKGNRKAFARLVDRYQKPIFNAARRLVNDDDDAQDITQNVFLKVFDNLERYDPRHKFYSWLFRIAVNESLDLLQRRGRQQAIDEEPASPDRNPEDSTRSAELSGMIQDALMDMKTDHRTVIVLRHFQQFSYRDMAELLDIPEKTVKSRLFTARRILRDRLVERGILEP